MQNGHGGCEGRKLRGTVRYIPIVRLPGGQRRASNISNSIMLRLSSDPGKRARRMGKWEMNKCCEFLLSYLFGFLFVHRTHWKYACCEIVALYCVEVLRIPKQLPLWTDLYAH